MNPRITKLRAERARNAEKIGRLTARNDEIDQESTKLEDLDIVDRGRGLGMTPDQLAALLRTDHIIPAVQNTKYSGDFSPSSGEKSSRQSAHFNLISASLIICFSPGQI